MPDVCTNWVQLIKKIGKEEREASKPCNSVMAKVVALHPLKVSLNQKHMISELIIDIPKSLTDYDIEISINGMKNKCTVHNALKVGDKLILLRQAGGQKYTVLDRM